MLDLLFLDSHKALLKLHLIPHTTAIIINLSINWLLQ